MIWSVYLGTLFLLFYHLYNVNFLQGCRTRRLSFPKYYANTKDVFSHQGPMNVCRHWRFLQYSSVGSKNRDLGEEWGMENLGLGDDCISENNKRVKHLRKQLLLTCKRLCWSPSQEKGPRYMNVCFPWMCSLLRCSRICSRREDNKFSEKGQIVNTLGFASHVLSLMNLLFFLQTFKNMKIISSLKIVWTRLSLSAIVCQPLI